MQVFIQTPNGDPVEAPSGTKIILDLGVWKTLELIVDEQDYRGDTVTLQVQQGKPFAKLVNATGSQKTLLVLGIKDIPADPTHRQGPIDPPKDVEPKGADVTIQ